MWGVCGVRVSWRCVVPGAEKREGLKLVWEWGKKKQGLALFNPPRRLTPPFSFLARPLQTNYVRHHFDLRASPEAVDLLYRSCFGNQGEPAGRVVSSPTPPLTALTPSLCHSQLVFQLKTNARAACVRARVVWAGGVGEKRAWPAHLSAGVGGRYKNHVSAHTTTRRWLTRGCGRLGRPGKGRARRPGGRGSPGRGLAGLAGTLFC